MKEKKKLIISISLITLSICLILIAFWKLSNDKEQVKNKYVTNTTVEIEQDKKNGRIFSKEDRKIAREKARKYIVFLTEFHGQTVQTTEDYKTIKNMMNERVKTLGILHRDVYIVPPTLSVLNDNDVIIFRMENFKLGDEFIEKYYEYINVHELVLPCTYTTPKNRERSCDFKFVKTLDGDVKIIETLLVDGIDFKSIDENAYYDEYYRKEMQQWAKEGLRIQ